MVVRFHGPAQSQAVRLQHRQVAVELGIHRIDDERLARGAVVQDVGIGAGGRIESCRESWILVPVFNKKLLYRFTIKRNQLSIQ